MKGGTEYLLAGIFDNLTRESCQKPFCKKFFKFLEKFLEVHLY